MCWRIRLQDCVSSRKYSISKAISLDVINRRDVELEGAVVGKGVDIEGDAVGQDEGLVGMEVGQLDGIAVGS